VFHFVRATALVSLAVLLLVPSAWAVGEPVAENDEASYYKVTDTVTDEAPTPEDTVLAKAQAWKCKTVYSTVAAYSLANLKLWSYRQKLGWCWSHGKVRSATPRCQGTYATVDAPLWNFEGHIECQYGGGVGESYVRRWRQGKFRACAAWCFQTKLPYVWIRGYADGSWQRGGGW
jgi:hypothetical protein